ARRSWPTLLRAAMRARAIVCPPGPRQRNRRWTCRRPSGAAAATSSTDAGPGNVRYDRILERLTPFPAELPPPGEALLPIVLDDRLRGPRVPPPGIVPKASAVLVLIHPDADGEARVVLTKRATRDGYHSGEVCFPGGRDEPGDDGAAGTALREAAEE